MKYLIIFIFLTNAGCSSYQMIIVPFNYHSVQLNKIDSASVGSQIIDIESGSKAIPSDSTRKLSLSEKDFFDNSDYGDAMELVYNGLKDNTINIIYREYNIQRNEKYIKEGFTQNLNYNLNSSKIIIFRKIRIDVLSANSNQIIYKVLSYE